MLSNSAVYQCQKYDKGLLCMIVLLSLFGIPIQSTCRFFPFLFLARHENNLEAAFACQEET